jgi:histidinol phosphatase-like enzyme
MGHCAKQDFPEIDFSKSLIAGNSLSDMEFGHALGIKTAFIDEKRKYVSEKNVPFADIKTASLYELALQLKDGHFQLY